MECVRSVANGVSCRSSYRFLIARPCHRPATTTTPHHVFQGFRGSGVDPIPKFIHVPFLGLLETVSCTIASMFLTATGTPPSMAGLKHKTPNICQNASVPSAKRQILQPSLTIPEGFPWDRLHAVVDVRFALRSELLKLLLKFRW